MASDIGFPGNFIRFVCQLHKALFTTICVYRQKPSFNVLFDDYLVTVMDINTLNRWLAVKAASVEGIPAVSLTTVGDAYVVDAGHHLIIIEVYHETVDKCRCKLLARYLETVDIKCFDREQIKKTFNILCNEYIRFIDQLIEYNDYQFLHVGFAHQEENPKVLSFVRARHQIKIK